MPSDLQVASREKRGRILPGNNSRTIKQARIAARLEELRAEYDPAGNASAIDRNRLKLAAMPLHHCRDGSRSNCERAFDAHSGISPV